MFLINVIFFGLVFFFIGVGYVEGGDFLIMLFNLVDLFFVMLMLMMFVVDVVIIVLVLVMILCIGREWI